MSLWKYLSQHNPWYKMTGLQDVKYEFIKGAAGTEPHYL